MSVIVVWLRRNPNSEASLTPPRQNIEGSWSPIRSKTRLRITRASPPRLERRRKGFMTANGTRA
uniref:Uncharacterized protein n=1 Tax=Oryza brachyantha TaxID=4533 RepID=J3LG04_ORYBR